MNHHSSNHIPFTRTSGPLTLLTALVSFFILNPPSLLFALPLGTAFTYQGRLNDGVSPANGSYDLRFALYDNSAGPGLVAGPITNAMIRVTNGLFTASIDFGQNVFVGEADAAVGSVGPDG